jgi:hypothetical protein
LDSRPLSGNSVRRAGSNSPPRSGPRPELRRGRGRDSVHSFFERFERSSPGGGGTRRVHFSAWVEIFATWRSIAFAFGRGCTAAGLSSEMYFILVRMPLRSAEAGRHYSKNCRVGHRDEGTDQALMGEQEVGFGTRSTTTRAGRTDPDRLNLHGSARWRFQVAGSTFPWLGVSTFPVI